MIVVGEPTSDAEFHNLLGALSHRVCCHRARKYRRHPHHHRRRREVHHDGEDVVEHPRSLDRQTQLGARTAGSPHGSLPTT